MFLKKLKKFFEVLTKTVLDTIFRKKHQPQISILIPFSSKDPVRIYTFKWLVEYWKKELPEAEVIVGRSQSRVFCKGEALNNAMKKARGKVIVIMDADAYISGEIIQRCADRILEEIDNHLWYVPYRNLYRLTHYITQLILKSNPARPLRLPSPPPVEYTENNRDKSKYGHRYGAMCMMFPREAFDVIGCFDERFKGWGGEDIALLRALDTLYGKHKTTKNDILHLWHPFIGHSHTERIWKGQKRANPNQKLANEYNRATRHPKKMKEIINDSQIYYENK